MARLASIQVGGYFKTPDTVLPLALHHLQLIKEPYGRVRPTIIDPCAGEGEAAAFFKSEWGGNLALVEMEKTRAYKCSKLTSYYACGDFFCLEFSGSGDFLWLNPPYDTDSETGRLEERFLIRATTTINSDGILAFVVPYYALKASAETLSRNYTDLQCFRFPESEWGSYKQVIVFGKKVLNTSGLPNPVLEEQILSWAQDPSDCPVLGTGNQTWPVRSRGSIYSWKMLPIDISSYEHSLWEDDSGELHDLCPPPISEIGNRVYPVASTPRAVHLAAALSAGIFNGKRITANNPGMPDLLVKGVFDKNFRKIDNKTNKKGEVVAEVQVQHPKLTVHVLDLSTGTYHEVAASGSSSDTVSVDSMTMRDLLDLYGESLMRGMLEACPVLHDPNPIPMPEMGRPLYPAQANAVRTLLKLWDKHPDRGAIVMGEIGCGKTSIALATVAAANLKRTLVVCPPHLLDSWAEQLAMVLPNAVPHVLNTLTDVDRFASQVEGMHVGILSREKAKLGYGRKSLKSCPKCGCEVKEKNPAKKRSKCKTAKYAPFNAEAKWVLDNLPQLARYMPRHHRSTFLGSVMRHAPKASEVDSKDLNLDGLLEFPHVYRDLCWFAPHMIPKVLDRNKSLSVDTIIGILLSLPVEEAASICESRKEGKGWGCPWTEAKRRLESNSYWISELEEIDGQRLYNKSLPRSMKAMVSLMDLMMARSEFDISQCGESLYTASSPVRYPLADWIVKRHPDCYDSLIIDEAHEFSSRDSAQTSAVQKLMVGSVPTLLLTGSLVNGYAESVYMNMYGIHPEFRQRYGRNGLSSFIDRYGYWKQIVQEKDIEGKVVSFGSCSDRVIRSVRKAGVAPGILPLFLLEYLLPCSVTIHKDDLGLGIPPRHDSRVDVTADGDLRRNYDRLLTRIKDEIKKSRGVPERSGRLWSALARVPSYLDLAVTGNNDESDAFEIRWPKEVPDVGGEVIVSIPTFGPNTILPKEAEVLHQVEAEIAEGRNVIIMCWHRRLIGRFEHLLSEAGVKAVVLDPAKVSTGKRQAWIDKKIVKANVPVMICNPITIQTGLNNLVHFSTQIWVENPMCDASLFRQACGRIDRIGQTQPSRIRLCVYTNTAQDQQHQLLKHKIGVSQSVDGLDPEEALRSAGVVDSDYMGFSLGRQLYKMLTDG